MKRIFSIISALGCVLSVSAQDYYTGRDQVSADGITFSVSVYQGLILSLSNIANTRGDAPEVYKDGSPIEPEFEEYAVANTVPGCVEKAFTETFTQEEYEMLKQDPTANIDIGYIISPQGVTEEVSFVMDYAPCMLRIPPAKYALLEKNLKRYVKWDVNLFGRKLQFMHGISFANFSKIRLQYPSSEPEIPDLTVPTVPLNPGDEELKPAPWK